LCIDNKHKENEMRFNLFKFELKRSSETVSGHVVASTEEHAIMVLSDQSDILARPHGLLLVERVDDTLTGDLRDGLDELLENAPACFASHSSIGWVAHVAPVKQLRLYRSEDHRGVEIFGVAPSVDVATAVFINALLPATQKLHRFAVADVTEDMLQKRPANLTALLKVGPVGIAEFDEEDERWWVW
jgi:hypothetical protein